MKHPQDSRSKPWTRWWWMGNAVTPQEITRHLEAYLAAGIGGVEITPIYGVRGQEHLFIPLLSPRWFELLRHTITEGQRLGIDVDMTLGSGWPYGGDHITLNSAARQAEVVRVDLPAGQSHHRFEGKQVEAARALGVDSCKLQFHAGTLTCDAPSSGGAVYVLLSSPTNQQVKRAAPGGQGHVMCPYRPESFLQFIEPYSAHFAKTLDRPRAAFYDSFEVYAANFAPGLPARFLKTHAYDLADHLQELAGEGDADVVARVRHDYRSALADFLLDEGIVAWVDWCRQHGILSRYQAHGAPGNLIDLYAAADIPETEVFGSSSFPWLHVGEHRQTLAPEYPLVNKLASSAAHLTGKPLASSETYTWLREHYCSTLAQMKAEADLLFFTGINHIFFHGSTYSPAEAGFPGWQFYASTHCDIADPLWHDLPQLNRYIAFCQDILQQSDVVADLLFYFPFHDIISRPGESLFMQLSVHGVPQWIAQMPWGVAAMQLWRRGYAFDFISDQLLDQCASDNGIKTPGGARYRAIVVPPVHFMPLPTLHKLTQLARAGVPVLVLAELPKSEPGLRGIRPNREFDTLRTELNALSHRVPGSDALPSSFHDLNISPCPATPIEGMRAMHLRRSGDDLYFLANFSAGPIATWVDLQLAPNRHWHLVDPTQLRETGRAAVANGRAYVQLKPGESAWLMPRSSAGAPLRYLRPTGQPINLDVTGHLEALEGGPTLPPTTPITHCGSWTDLSPAWRDFSGTARYTLTFDFAGDPAQPHILRFPAVGESVRVILNGQPQRTLWCSPFELEIDHGLLPGQNVLICEVTNLGANRIAAMDRQGIPWRNFYDANIVDLNYRPFDASKWPPRPSGLLAQPQLIAAESFSPTA